MSLRTQLVRGLRSLRRPAAADRDVADEVEHYLAEAATAYRERGLSEADAQRAARLDMRSRTSVRQQVQAIHWETWIESLITDLRRAARRLRRSPGFGTVQNRQTSFPEAASNAATKPRTPSSPPATPAKTRPPAISGAVVA